MNFTNMKNNKTSTDFVKKEKLGFNYDSDIIYTYLFIYSLFCKVFNLFFLESSKIINFEKLVAITCSQFFMFHTIINYYYGVNVLIYFIFMKALNFIFLMYFIIL